MSRRRRCLEGKLRFDEVRRALCIWTFATGQRRAGRLEEMEDKYARACPIVWCVARAMGTRGADMAQHVCDRRVHNSFATEELLSEAPQPTIEDDVCARRTSTYLLVTLSFHFQDVSGTTRKFQVRPLDCDVDCNRRGKDNTITQPVVGLYLDGVKNSIVVHEASVSSSSGDAETNSRCSITGQITACQQYHERNWTRTYDRVAHGLVFTSRGSVHVRPMVKHTTCGRRMSGDNHTTSNRDVEKSTQDNGTANPAPFVRDMSQEKEMTCVHNRKPTHRRPRTTIRCERHRTLLSRISSR